MTTAQLPIHRSPGVVHAMTLARNDMLAQTRATAREPDACFPAAFGHLVDAIEAIFRTEEGLLEMARAEHAHAQRQDNALLLAALHHAASQVEGGNLEIGRDVVAALPDLLSLHQLEVLRGLAVRARGQQGGAGPATHLSHEICAGQAGEGAR